MESIAKIYHEILLLLKFLQIKPQPVNMKINYYELYYTVVKNRDDKEDVNDKYEKNGIDYINFFDIITPNHYIGRKNNKKNIERENIEISYESFQSIYTIQMIMNDENKKLSRNRKRRIQRKNKLDDKMKTLFNKNKSEKKKRIKNIDKINQLVISLVKNKYATTPNKLQSELKDLNKIHVVDKNLHEFRNDI